MKKIVLLLSMFLLLGNAVIADDKSSVGFVDVRKILLESKVGKKNRAEFEKIVKAKETALSKEQEKLKASQEAFQKESVMLSSSQKKTRERALRDQAEAYNKMVKEAQQEISKKDNEYANRSLGEIRAVIAEVAKEMQLSLVLEASESGLLYADNSLDLTQKVMQRYDAKSK